jgi:hypothetical protein
MQAAGLFLHERTHLASPEYWSARAAAVQLLPQPFLLLLALNCLLGSADSPRPRFPFPLSGVGKYEGVLVIQCSSTALQVMADRPVQPVADQSSSSSRSNSSNEPLKRPYRDSRGSGDTTSSNGSESRPVAAASSNLKANPPQISECRQPSASEPEKASREFLDAHRGFRGYPIMEISRMDQTKQQVLQALHHIERKKANAPNLISPNFQILASSSLTLRISRKDCQSTGQKPSKFR